MKRSVLAMLVGAVVGAGLPVTAAAQQSPNAPLGRPVERAERSAERKSGRAAEIAAELAWAADPVTFPYRLRAKAAGEGLELTGFVPSALIQARAAGLAQTAAGVPVTNRLIVQANMEMPPPAMPAESFASDVRGRLEQVGTSQISRVEVRLAPTGVVTLSGHVPSAEDRLRYSQCLRGLPGCAAVKNELIAQNDTPPATVVTMSRPELKPAPTPPATPVPPAPLEPLAPPVLPPLTVAERPVPPVTLPPLTASVATPAPTRSEPVTLPSMRLAFLPKDRDVAVKPAPTMPNLTTAPLAPPTHMVGTVRNPVVQQVMVPTAQDAVPAKAEIGPVLPPSEPRPLFRDADPAVPALLPAITVRDASRPCVVIFDVDPPLPKGRP